MKVINVPRHKTIDDLAREAQVSVSTIDRILSGRGQVKPTTIEHVLAVAEQIGFYAVESIRSRLVLDAPERRFGFLLNSADRQLYRDLAEELSGSARKAVNLRGQAVVRHLNDTDPENAARALLELGEQCDVIACVCVDHPAVSTAVGELERRGVPVITMISDISSPARIGFVGSNDWQLGRTAGWFCHRVIRSGKVAVLTGSERYTCQQVHDASFRGFLRSQQADFTLLESRVTHEDDSAAEAITRSLLDEHADLAALFVAGGGLDGVCMELLRRGRKDVMVIGCEMTGRTRSRLSSGEIDVILAHPVDEIARRTVQAMIKLITSPTPHQPFQTIVPFAVVVTENC
ncbi:MULTISPECIES: LacI family DNA-binding transcriptional regulator [unclassified Rhizobium]|uniref:LacI family DNA-binding transcriptional regulator n=1 Tax=unclassified Rhizobium TaxID=2613769 RepID=UPI001FD7AA12|nr:MULTISPECIES: LacI family DNA-binding transcriptional regulator [unclassified Rhizobium]